MLPRLLAQLDAARVAAIAARESDPLVLGVKKHIVVLHEVGAEHHTRALSEVDPWHVLVRPLLLHVGVRAHVHLHIFPVRALEDKCDRGNARKIFGVQSHLAVAVLSPGETSPGFLEGSGGLLGQVRVGGTRIHNHTFAAVVRVTRNGEGHIAHPQSFQLYSEPSTRLRQGHKLHGLLVDGRVGSANGHHASAFHEAQGECLGLNQVGVLDLGNESGRARGEAHDAVCPLGPKQAGLRELAPKHEPHRKGMPNAGRRVVCVR
mmetsp:Transcript_20712/g.60537  ORF Transcript_20712/g.60537 Transcript_20712/m.60537 type:complete len:262 (-) Transcript_20712:548-1333(-)